MNVSSEVMSLNLSDGVKRTFLMGWASLALELPHPDHIDYGGTYIRIWTDAGLDRLNYGFEYSFETWVSAKFYLNLSYKRAGGTRPVTQSLFWTSPYAVESTMWKTLEIMERMGVEVDERP